MKRNRNLTVESLEGKMLQATTAMGLASFNFVTAHVATLPHGPATGTGYTAFATVQSQTASTGTSAHLPHGPATGTGYTAY